MMKLKKEKKHLNFGDTIEIDHRVYSRNMIDRWHWSKKQKLKNEYRILVRNQMRLHNIEPTEKSAYLELIAMLRD